MKKTLQVWGTFIVILFLFPIILNLLPNKSPTVTAKMMKEPLKIVYASNIFEDELAEESNNRVLLYYTHNHEAYEPITAEKDGKVAVSHRTENITKFGEKLQAQLAANDVATDILPVDTAEELDKKGMPFSQSYHAIRPFVQSHIAEADADYDLIIDLHRDSIGRKQTTMSHKGQDYARVAFVIGLEHPNYKQNEQKALNLTNEMEKIVPGITRNLIRKSGKGVDGKYNQDLHPNIILVELGGPENKEDELNRTVAVIAEAASKMFMEENNVEN